LNLQKRELISALEKVYFSADLEKKKLRERYSSIKSLNF